MRGRLLHVRPGDSVQAPVAAVAGPGWTVVVHPGTYREEVKIPAVGVRSAIFSERDVHRCLGGGPGLAPAGNDVGRDPADVHDRCALTSRTAVGRYALRHPGAGRPCGRP